MLGASIAINKCRALRQPTHSRLSAVIVGSNGAVLIAPRRIGPQDHEIEENDYGGTLGTK